ncbi:MAG: hypothetical protein WBA74_04740 [Cyclobacteriaceae bacterium]
MIYSASAQEVPAYVYYNNLSQQTVFPESLQSERSAAVINVSGDWKKFAAKIHEKLRLMSVDVIQYIDYNDLTAGDDVTAPIVAYLNKRNVKFIITFSVNEEGLFEMNISDMENFLKSGKHPATRFTNSDPDGLLRYVANELIRAELNNDNFLIPEKPEFLLDIDMVKGRKFNVHARDVATLKLAVPRFQKISDEVIATSNDQGLLKAYNRKMDNWNKELEAMMLKFPYKFELVNTTDATELYRQGFQFVLLPVTTRGISIKKMLNIAVDDSETEFISHGPADSLIRIDVEDIVTKFYIKQLYTKDLYVGDKWDADVTWQKALDNFLFNYRAFVKK